MKNTSSVIDMSVYDMSVVVAEITEFPRDEFQKEVGRLMTLGLNGLAYRTEHVENLLADIRYVVFLLHKKYGCEGYVPTVTTCCNKCSKDGAEIGFRVTLAELSDSSNLIGHCFAVLDLIPVQGVFVRSEAQSPHMFAVRFDNSGREDVYNKTLAEEGGRA